MAELLRGSNALIGSTKNPLKEQFTMRGHLDSLENCLNDMLNELSYHTQQMQITSSEKDTAGALIEMNVC